ncbi:MAG: FGGY-family carbohydrate kinase [Elainella sp.]
MAPAAFTQHSNSAPQPDYALGIDFGTSGARAMAIDRDGNCRAQAAVALLHQTPADWQQALENLLQALPLEVRQALGAIAVNGTSSTVLLCDQDGHPVAEPLLYNDSRGAALLDQVKAIAPAQHTVISATSSLAKLLWWQQQPEIGQATHFLHQADWLGFLLHGRLGLSDYHNALKLGYDPERLAYPDWLIAGLAGLPVQLPEVWAPGTAVGPIRPELAARFGIPAACLVGTGTTDSIAAFLASGVQTPGAAVTSLGSTLVLKLLSTRRVDSAPYGIYSHRLGDLWLVGGASNTGGAVLRQFFSDTELTQLSAQIQPEQPSPFDYYPLLQPGERFPINDPDLPPRLTPRPDPVPFLHGLLESMARIETQGYQRLQELGAPALQQVYTAGGGAKNPAWTAIRARLLQVPVRASLQTEAAYGTALLARQIAGGGGES